MNPHTKGVKRRHSEDIFLIAVLGARVRTNQKKKAASAREYALKKCMGSMAAWLALMYQNETSVSNPSNRKEKKIRPKRPDSFSRIQFQASGARMESVDTIFNVAASNGASINYLVAVATTAA